MSQVKRAAGMSAWVAFVWIAGAAAVFAQSDMRGHWVGSIETPQGQLGVEVDLDKPASGWIGSISIPQQGASGIPLDAISFDGGKGSFRLKGIPGDPTFTGTLSADGKSIQGNLAQGPGAMPMKLSRTGEAKVEVPKASPAVSPEFAGSWEGTIPGGPRIMLTISNSKAGAEAQLVSPDQGNAQIPVSAVIQSGTRLSLRVNAVSGGYAGEINKEGTELNGTWTQGGNSIPLQFKKAAAPAAKP
jgi:hypothetical protein